MTSVPASTGKSAAAVPAETVQARCDFYRAYGIDAYLQVDLRRLIVVANSRLAGLTLPAELAMRVRGRLRVQQIDLGPVISHPRSKRWTLLVTGNVPADKVTCARLFRHQVSVVRSGTQIALPAPIEGYENLRYWVEPPTAPLPSGAVVAQAILECVEQARCL
ncbi:DNA-directed RNA polymerase subunit beta [Nocardia asteroides]|uniref:DNA-directed RNA polymerase subunit beta n=1 Tax=Nocardia asteroides TaxID=1824 RepID=UPI0037CB98E2